MTKHRSLWRLLPWRPTARNAGGEAGGCCSLVYSWTGGLPIMESQLRGQRLESTNRQRAGSTEGVGAGLRTQERLGQRRLLVDT